VLIPKTVPHGAQRANFQDIAPAPVRTPIAVLIAPAGTTRFVPNRLPKNVTRKANGAASEELAFISALIFWLIDIVAASFYPPFIAREKARV
jgi:hypothetical protein